MTGLVLDMTILLYVIQNDEVLHGNTTVLSDNKNTGVTFFVNKRVRDWYDYNNDNYSEIPKVKINNFGTNFFF